MSVRQVMRLRSYIQIGICLAVCAFLLNATLEVLAFTPALQWLPEKVTGTGFIEDIRQRVGGAIREYEDGKINPREYLCAIVGSSNVREGISLPVLSNEAGEGWRFLGLAGAGGLGIENVEEVANPILGSTLKPDLVVVGLTPVHVLDTVLAANIATLTKTEFEKGTLKKLSFDFDSLKKILKSWTWIYSRRDDIRLSTEDLLLSFKASNFRALGVRVSALDPKSPWRDMLKTMGAEHFPEGLLKQTLLRTELAGAFDEDTYVHSVRSRALLAALVKRFHDRGAQVIVLLTPEHSWLTSREPKGIGNYLKTALESELDQHIEFLDYRNAINDSGFVDLVHLNTAGRAQFSRLLAKDIQRVKFDHSPLMSIRP